MTDSEPTGVVIHGPSGRIRAYGRFNVPNVMTEEQRAAHIRALIEERRGYEVRGEAERAAQVNEQLRQLGVEAAPPARRASKRVKSAKEER